MNSERVAVFIDGSNFYHACKKVLDKNPKINFESFRDWLVGTRKLIRTYYYNISLKKEQDPIKYKAQQRFFETLRKTPYFVVRLGRLDKRSGREKGVDIKIAMDMLMLAYNNTYDTAILVSGDGDYAHVLEEIKSLGKHVEVAFFWEKECQSYHLRIACDKFIELNSGNFKKYLM